MPPRNTSPSGLQRPPLYDPAVHTDPHEVVFVELYCQCGSVRKFQDPVAWIDSQVRGWLDDHPIRTIDGGMTGHGPVSIAECVAEQEARREAAFRAVGDQPSYTPREHPDMDTTCTRPRPWPTYPVED